jgi:hypothetical protein
MIGHTAKNNGINLKIKIHLDSISDPVDFGCRKVDLVNCEVSLLVSGRDSL